MFSAPAGKKPLQVTPKQISPTLSSSMGKRSRTSEKAVSSTASSSLIPNVTPKADVRTIDQIRDNKSKASGSKSSAKNKFECLDGKS